MLAPTKLKTGNIVLKSYYRQNKMLQAMNKKNATIKKGIVAIGETKSWNQ